jgi:hypothetical protein
MSIQQNRAREPTDPPSSLAQAVAHLSDASRALSDAARCLQGAGERSLTHSGSRRVLAPDERLTLKQLGAVRSSARRAGLSEKAVRDLVGEVSREATDVTELSKLEASALLDRLNAQSGFLR